MPHLGRDEWVEESREWNELGGGRRKGHMVNDLLN